MELWRVLGAVAVGSLVIVTLTVLLVLTVLPQVVVWGIAVAAWLIMLALFLSG
jgi:hypothetical protein